MAKAKNSGYLEDGLRRQMKAAASYTAMQTAIVMTFFPAIVGGVAYFFYATWPKEGKELSTAHYLFYSYFGLIALAAVVVIIGRILGFFYKEKVAKPEPAS